MQRIYDEVVNEGNLNVIDELFAEAFVEHEEFPGIPPTREGVKQFFTMFRAAFPDVTFEVEHMLGEGVFVAARARCHGTHQGEFMGVPASGRPIDVEVFDLVRFDGGLAVAHWGAFDGLIADAADRRDRAAASAAPARLESVTGARQANRSHS